MWKLAGDELADDDEKLPTGMVDSGSYAVVSWQDAFTFVGRSGTPGWPQQAIMLHVLPHGSRIIAKKGRTTCDSPAFIG